LPFRRFIASETELSRRKALFAMSAVAVYALICGVVRSVGLPAPLAVGAALLPVAWLAFRLLWSGSGLPRSWGWAIAVVPALPVAIALAIVGVQRASLPNVGAAEAARGMPFAALFAGAVLGALIVLLIQGRRDERAAVRAWVPLLTPRREIYLKRTESQLHDGLTLADVAYDRAHSLQELGSAKEARELLSLGYQMVDRFAPDLLRLLSMMTVYSRMVSAVVPVRPVSPARFQTTGVSIMVRFAAVAHHFLASTMERFRFRLFVIGQSARLLLRGLGRATIRILGAKGLAPDLAPDEAWEQIRAIRSDFHALTDESIESLHDLLMSLDAAQHQGSTPTPPTGTLKS
jgi:hypothetical protein